MKENIKVILVEDDSKKIDDVKFFFSQNVPNSILTIKESYQSGIREILHNDYDLLLLDMSLPTYDKTPYEQGGPHEKFGGYLLLKELIRNHRKIKTVLITMFDDFGESDLSITLTQINEILQNEFSDVYLGAVFYNSKENKWQEDLKVIVEKQRND